MQLDVGPILPSIQARTLIVPRAGSVLFDPESVRAVAKRIPGRRAPAFQATMTCPTSAIPTPCWM
jgi:hypothetical protein